jgi:hypothetical protein
MARKKATNTAPEPDDIDEFGDDEPDEDVDLDPDIEEDADFDDDTGDEDDSDFDDDSEDEESEDGETLDELEAEELEMLTEDEASEVLAVDEAAELAAIRREELALRVEPEEAKTDEFVCSVCFLVKRKSQLADRRKKICRDCVE